MQELEKTRLVSCIETIERNLPSKGEFLASTQLQDKVLSGLHELSETSRGYTWGYRRTATGNAWLRINNLVFQQLLLPGEQGIDSYKVWQVVSECLPIIKYEVRLW